MTSMEIINEFPLFDAILKRFTYKLFNRSDKCLIIYVFAVIGWSLDSVVCGFFFFFGWFFIYLFNKVTHTKCSRTWPIQFYQSNLYQMFDPLVYSPIALFLSPSPVHPFVPIPSFPCYCPIKSDDKGTGISALKESYFHSCYHSNFL